MSKRDLYYDSPDILELFSVQAVEAKDGQCFLGEISMDCKWSRQLKQTRNQDDDLGFTYPVKSLKFTEFAIF